MKIPFDIKYRPQIESGEYKVETRDGRKARIIHWDLNCTSPIVAVMDADIDLPGEIVDVFSVSGMAFDDTESPSDLFIVTPEPEMTVFEKKVYAYCDGKTVGEELIKRIAKELLSLARDQFIKDGYVLEKQSFHDAVEKVTPEVMKEVSDKVDMEEALRLGYEKGRADALKDLPRWEKCNFRIGSDNPFPRYLVKTGAAHYSLTSVLLRCDEYIPLSELAKLPNEDSHE